MQSRPRKKLRSTDIISKVSNFKMRGTNKKEIRLEPNQRDHLIQWLALILVMELIIILVPIASWIKIVLIGIAFLGGYLLRAIRKYPGEYEPLWVDLSTAGISFSIALLLWFLNNNRANLAIVVISPAVILVPHFSYIIGNKKIKVPGFRKFIKW